MASVWLNQQQENELRLVGFGIPEYPASGDVTLNDEVIGTISNFSGLITRSKKAVELIESLGGFCIWNPTEIDC